MSACKKKRRCLQPLFGADCCPACLSVHLRRGARSRVQVGVETVEGVAQLLLGLPLGENHLETERVLNSEVNFEPTTTTLYDTNHALEIHRKTKSQN